MHIDSQAPARYVETLRSVVLRPALFVGACLLLWGSLIAGVFFWRLFTSGVAAATAPFGLGGGARWTWWANLASGLGATIFWVLITGLALASRASPPPPGSER